MLKTTGFIVLANSVSKMAVNVIQLILLIWVFLLTVYLVPQVFFLLLTIDEVVHSQVHHF